MVDGLDEVISRDPGVFDLLLEMATGDGDTPAKVLVCLRDSLLATNAALSEFWAEFPVELTVYRLSPWSSVSISEYALLRLGKAEATAFEQLLEENHDLRALASTPFYSKLLIDEYAADRLEAHVSGSALIELSIDGIIAREVDKGLIDPKVVDQEAIMELLEYLAVVDFEGGLRGIDPSELREIAPAVLPDGLSEQESEMFSERLIQLPLFISADVRVAFAQELVEQHLLGLAIARAFESSNFVNLLDRGRIPDDWLTLDVAASHIESQQGGDDRLRAIAQASAYRADAFNNLVKLAARVKPASALRSLPMENADLEGIRFESVDFAEVSFRNSNLTNVTFVDCRLEGTAFDGAILQNTAYVGTTTDHLDGASFADLRKFHSIMTSEGLIDDFDEVSKWVTERTGKGQDQDGACACALQLRFLFGKFVHPDGRGRRARLPMRAALAGRRYVDPNKIIGASVRHGYLLTDTARNRYQRPDGDRYAEMIAYRTEFTLVPELRRLLDSVCELPDCSHVSPEWIRQPSRFLESHRHSQVDRSMKTVVRRRREGVSRPCARDDRDMSIEAETPHEIGCR